MAAEGMSSSTLKAGSLKVGLPVKPCCTQAGIHAPTSLRLPRICSTAAKVSLRYSSMASRMVWLQFWILQGGSLLDVQSVNTMLSIDYWSQGDSTMNMGALRYLARLPALQQWQKPSNSDRHSGIGQPTPSLRVILNRVSPTAFMVSMPANGEKYSVTNSPLSGMAQTLAFFVFSTRQLEYRNVAIPPAETPVITMASLLQKSNSLSKQQKPSIVLLYPRKQSCLSLYEIGSALVPLYSLPSQQTTKIFVQSQKTGFKALSVAKSPPLSKLQVGGAFLVVPRLPFERLQQLQRTSAAVKPAQKPPPSQKIINLFLLTPEPRWQYMAGGVPSRQAAPRSWERRASLYRLSWRWTCVNSRSKAQSFRREVICFIYIVTIHRPSKNIRFHILHQIHQFSFLHLALPQAIIFRQTT